MADTADHVQNTTQLLVDKALGEIERYHDHKDDGWRRPYPYIDAMYPIVMNHGEGYRLFPEDDGSVRFRITATSGTHVKDELTGSSAHLERVRTALQNDSWRVGTAEVLHKHGEWQLHVSVTHEAAEVADTHDADTVMRRAPHAQINHGDLYEFANNQTIYQWYMQARRPRG